MTQIKLSKSSLSQEQKNLKNYRQFLPSLELKRQKLLIEKNKAHKELERLKAEMIEKEKWIARHLPMIADREIKLENLVELKSVEINKENIVGVNLPIVEQINFNVKEYSLFNTPLWLDSFINELKNIIKSNIFLQLATMRIHLLRKSLQTVTQRKNLFEKVLIPKSTTTIRYIQIYLADNERAAVVRSKIAKKKRRII